MQRLLGLFRPTIYSLGYAAFLAVNATGIWGGVFPFLPFEIQTGNVMLAFYLAQSVMLFAVFSIVGLSCFIRGHLKMRSSRRVVASAAAYLAGWAFLIASMYLHSCAFVLTVFGGVFLGIGAGLFYLLWQRLFAGEGADEGMHDLILSFVYAAVIYVALYAVPRAVTAYLIPLVFLPLLALALILGNRRIDFSQPMFADEPRENMRVYRRAFTSIWRSALSLGAIAFSTGIVRSIAIEQPEVGSLVNVLSMAMLFVVALSVIYAWQLKGVKMNLIKLYRIVFPLLITAFAVLPFVWSGYARWLAAVLYALYSIGLMLISMQCAQTARDRGVNPSFIFGLAGGIVYGLNDIGFITGSAVRTFAFDSVDPTVLTAIMAIYLFALMFFFGTVDFSGGGAQILYGDTIELVAPVREHRGDGQQTDMRKKKGAANDGREFRDRVDKQVAGLQEAYGLSEREAEVVGLIVRGNTVANIAERLFISENTVRTHTKRIYSKLDVHKKQELIALVERF